jgi:hypothetical protein
VREPSVQSTKSHASTTTFFLLSWLLFIVYSVTHSLFVAGENGQTYRKGKVKCPKRGANPRLNSVSAPSANSEFPPLPVDTQTSFPTRSHSWRTEPQPFASSWSMLMVVTFSRRSRMHDQAKRRRSLSRRSGLISSRCCTAYSNCTTATSCTETSSAPTYSSRLRGCSN